MNSGLYERPGVSATACAAACARRLEEAATKDSNVNFESSCTAGDSQPCPLAGDGAGAAGTGFGSAGSPKTSPRPDDEEMAPPPPRRSSRCAGAEAAAT